MLGKKDIIKRCKEIIKESEEILNKKDNGSKTYEIMRLTSSIENIYNLVYPKGVPSHLSIENFKKIMINMGYKTTRYTPVGIFLLILQKFKGFTEDLEKGVIDKLSNIISLDLFNDLLEQSSELRTHNTEPLNRAACVLTRIVLEDTLKKICLNNAIILKTDKASEANVELRKSTIYGKTQWRIIQGWLDIGNEAAHPDTDFSLISEIQMDDMIKRVKEFSLNFLS